MTKSALQKSHMRLNTILNGGIVRIKIQCDSLKRKVLIDFLRLFKEATFPTSAGSLFQSAGAAAAKERAPSVGSICCTGGSSSTVVCTETVSIDLSLTVISSLM